MNRQSQGFPLIVGLAVTHGGSVSEDLLGTIKKVFGQLREQSPSGVLIVYSDGIGYSEKIAQAAKEAGVIHRIIEPGLLEKRESRESELTRAGMELAEASDVLILVSPATGDEHKDPATNDLLAYARDIGRPVIHVGAGTRTSDVDQVNQIERQPGWLPDLFETAGLSLNADLETIKSKMSAVANRAAPLTRRWWKWILILQGLAALIPLAWLMQPSRLLPIEWVGAAVLFSVMLLTAVIWWLRWRGMQKTWARARLVAELARSMLATSSCPAIPALRTLSIVPSLRPLRWVASTAGSARSFVQWRDQYLGDRIDGQERYFAAKQKEAEGQRKQLSRWVTVLLDIGLAFAFAGAVLSLTSLGQIWLEILGGVRLEIAFGVAGTLVPIGLLLVQVLRGVEELNRRTARFAQQRQILQDARTRLTSVKSTALAMDIIGDIERQLLAEVLEWYFHAETAEHFFGAQETRDHFRASSLEKKSAKSTAPGLSWTILGKTGSAGLFLARVILGRLPWIVGSGTAILVWVIYHQPGSEARRDQLQALAHLTDGDGGPWRPSPERAKNGCVIIVHGLYGKLSFQDLTRSEDSPSGRNDQSKRWMKDCADAIEERMQKEGKGVPNICLLDWHEAAQPSAFYDLGWESSLLSDVPAIRPQAQEVGDLVAFRLAKLIKEKMIRKDQPCHLIGHSAGGFVVARTAVMLTELGLAPEHLQVTILDTPGPDSEICTVLPKACSTDFCITSSMGGVVPVTDVQEVVHTHKLLKLADFSAPHMHMIRRSPPADKTGWKAHQWAYTWFIETIKNPSSDPGEGFNRSPLLQQPSSKNGH